MGESFYSVLGVGADADADAIERAYRERVKKHHPDVSDTPDARQKFKRLTVARDTLVDGDERFRYDTLGHERYVSQHTPPGLFDVEGSSSGAGTESQPTADTGESTTQSATTTSTGSSTQSEAASRVATDGGSAPWESPTASATGGRSHSNPTGTSGIYDTRSSGTAGGSGGQTLSDLTDGVRSLAPWCAFYLLALVAVVAIGMPVFGGGIAVGSAATAVFVSVIVVVTLSASAMHFVSLMA